MELEHCPVHMDLLSAAGYLILCCNKRAAINPKIVSSRFLLLCKDCNQRSSTSETRYWHCCDRSHVQLLQYHVPCRLSSFSTLTLSATIHNNNASYVYEAAVRKVTFDIGPDGHSSGGQHGLRLCAQRECLCFSNVLAVVHLLLEKCSVSAGAACAILLPGQPSL